MLQELVETYGASGHEELMRQNVTKLLPNWAKPETDDAGNLILQVGTAPAGTKTPKILVVAHMDEIGFEVKSISKDGRLEVETLGGMDLSFYEGHPMLVHTSTGDRDAIMELPNGWDEAEFQMAGRIGTDDPRGRRRAQRRQKSPSSASKSAIPSQFPRNIARCSARARMVAASTTASAIRR